MKSEKLNEFAKMLSEELKKKSSDELIPESIQDEHNKLLDNSTKNDNVPAEPSKIETQRWNDPLQPLDQKFVTVKEMNDHYGLFLKRIQQQISTMGGGGEVNFRYLDDVKRSTMNDSNNNWLLEYDSSSKKVQFTNQLGPVDLIYFDREHEHTETKIPGTLCWNYLDQTLNIEHPGGVTQQVGQETYAYIRNGTANTIPNGTAVMFAGAEPDSTSGARLLVAPIVADGTFPSLYGLGIATQDLEPGQDGRVTVWGKVREVNTSSWQIGNILYADPENEGQLTNIKPTAPNNVIPMAAVLKVGVADGEIFVRPTINQMMYYGRFSRLTDITIPNTNQGYPIAFDTVDISNGIIFNGGSDTQIIVPDSGFYQADISAQVSATSNKGVVYFWFRKNGIDIPHSTRSTTVTNGDTFNISTAIQISLDANDYIEIIWARTAGGIILNALTPGAFAPSASAITVNITQVQL